MTAHPPFRIEHSPEVKAHLTHRTGAQRATVIDAIDVQLLHQPTVITRNRKPLDPNPYAQFELRVGKLRVYYEVDEGARVVLVRGVAIKDRNRIVMGGVEIDLR